MTHMPVGRSLPDGRMCAPELRRIWSMSAQRSGMTSTRGVGRLAVALMRLIGPLFRISSPPEKAVARFLRASLDEVQSGTFFDQDKILKMAEDNFQGKTDDRRKIWTVYTFLVWYKLYFIDNFKPDESAIDQTKQKAAN